MWRYAVARATGLSHLKSGAPCQDRCAQAINADGLIVAVSDGAGSAALSEVGAEIAVTKSVEFLKPHFDDPGANWLTLVGDAARIAKVAIHAEAIQACRSPRDYACTLLIVVLGPNGGAALQIGDGVIAYRDAEAWGHVFWPQKGEYANTTRFLIEENAEDHFETVALKERFLELAVMTDGLESLALHFASHTVHEPFLESVISPLRKSESVGEVIAISAALEKFLKSERITSRTDDDLTLFLAARGAA